MPRYWRIRRPLFTMAIRLRFLAGGAFAFLGSMRLNFNSSAARAVVSPCGEQAREALTEHLVKRAVTHFHLGFVVRSHSVNRYISRLWIKVRHLAWGQETNVVVHRYALHVAV